VFSAQGRGHGGRAGVPRWPGAGDVVVAVSFTVEVPTPIPSVANKRWHWSKRHRHFASHRRVVALVLAAKHSHALLSLPLKVTVVRIAPRRLDPDNAVASLKGIIDGVADWLGIDDGDGRIEWAWGQERGAPKYQAVRIIIEEQ